jgi:Tfp pilus assembly protein PilF
LHDKEELQQAITLFNEALDCNPQNIVVHASLGRIYEHQAKNALTREERLEPLRLAHHHYAVVQMFRP